MLRNPDFLISQTISGNMMKLFYVFIILSFMACSSKMSQNKNVHKTSCSNKYDSLYYGMEPLKNDSSEIGFIDIRACKTYIKNDSLVIEINTREIPDSITYNNPNIAKGYSEFALEVAYRHKKHSDKNNIVFALYYNNFDKPRGEVKGSFMKFLNDCALEIYLEREDTISNGESKFQRDFPISEKAVNISSNKTAFFFKIQRDSICPFLGDYFGREFNVKMCYNDCKIQAQNNYLTSMLVSDTILIHNFIWNSSRRVE